MFTKIRKLRKIRSSHLLGQTSLWKIPTSNFSIKSKVDIFKSNISPHRWHRKPLEPMLARNINLGFRKTPCPRKAVVGNLKRNLHFFGLRSPFWILGFNVQLLSRNIQTSLLENEAVLQRNISFHLSSSRRKYTQQKRSILLSRCIELPNYHRTLWIIQNERSFRKLSTYSYYFKPNTFTFLTKWLNPITNRYHYLLHVNVLVFWSVVNRLSLNMLFKI